MNIVNFNFLPYVDSNAKELSINFPYLVFNQNNTDKYIKKGQLPPNLTSDKNIVLSENISILVESNLLTDKTANVLKVNNRLYEFLTIGDYVVAFVHLEEVQNSVQVVALNNVETTQREVKKVLDRIKEDTEEIKDNTASIDNKLTTTNEKLEVIKTNTNVTNNKLDTTNSKLDNVNTKLGILSTESTQLENKNILKSVDNKLSTVASKLDDINSNIGGGGGGTAQTSATESTQLENKKLLTNIDGTLVATESEIQTHARDNKSALSSVNSNISSSNSYLSSISGKVATENTLNTIKNTVNTMNTNVSNIYSRVATETSLNTVKNTLNTVNTNISNINSKVSTETTLKAVQSLLTDIKNKIGSGSGGGGGGVKSVQFGSIPSFNRDVLTQRIKISPINGKKSVCIIQASGVGTYGQANYRLPSGLPCVFQGFITSGSSTTSTEFYLSRPNYDNMTALTGLIGSWQVIEYY